MNSQSSYISKWISLNFDLQYVCEKIGDTMLAKPKDAFINIALGYLLKSTRTLKAVNILYNNNLNEQAQSLVRILLELRLNFDCFLKMSNTDLQNTCMRVVYSMMLEKVKQARASGFTGMRKELIDDLLDSEKEISNRYSPDELKNMRRFGFTGMNIESRADFTGHKEAYDIIYRNFSRNIHSTDYLEYYIIQNPNFLKESEYTSDYLESRDIASLYTAHFSAGGIAEFANHIFKCGLDKELDKIGIAQRKLKDERELGLP